MSARDELIEILHRTATADRVKNAALNRTPVVKAKVETTADAIIAAGYRKPLTITTAEELDALPYGAAVIHEEGWGVTVAQRHAEDMRWYVTGCLEYIRPEALLPATVLHEPEAGA